MNLRPLDPQSARISGVNGSGNGGDGDAGDREEWRPIACYRGVYEVSNLGRVRSVDHYTGNRFWPGRVLKTAPNNKGYQYLQLSDHGVQRWHGVHVLVYETFIGKVPAGLEVCHENGSKSDNRLANLRADTPKGNNADKLQHGTAQRGERHGAHKLTVEKVREIRASVASIVSLARAHGVSETAISDIRKRKTWGWLDA